MKIKTHVKPGDEVVVIAGNHKDRDKKLTVLSVNAAKNQVILDGARKMKKGIRKSEENPDGGFEEVDGPIHISNVKKV